MEHIIVEFNTIDPPLSFGSKTKLKVFQSNIPEDGKKSDHFS